MDGDKTAIIVAGGSGKRMQQAVPKQFMLLQDKPVLMHTLERFYHFDMEMELIVVLPPTSLPDWKELVNQYNCRIPHTLVAGGHERYHSVKNGLQAVRKGRLIAVQDGVRPLVSQQTIAAAFKAAATYGAAVPAVAPKESLRQLTEAGSRAVDRRRYRMIQTPQVFRSEILQEAYQQPYRSFFTDDASLVEYAGYNIHLVEGNRHNMKITTPEDMDIARLFLKQESQ
mgnify:CR=1 FL=1